MMYETMLAEKDKEKTVEFIYDRFVERYIVPLKNVAAGKENGFLTMGVSCLLIEGLTAFREGWPSTKGRSEEAFRLFFARESRFAVFRGREKDFWKGVRCGILHQGETAQGWRLNFSDMSKPLFQEGQKKINCRLFFTAIEEVLGDYRQELLNSDWESTVWINFRNKMDQTIKDCTA